ncbi:hypothetical protein [Anaeromyxobacter diazotrophicus]|uniref:Uncharacterized protein n=1 Tax=Anaeromyxobacter diazotrophicus TaxID=2590199 RepID=A0A7I9VN51_9BACT|nr:hypothetical protein [Anaeromyxobacter diazotrophicus]GEJ57832.1 hypothetical protein AMYX_25730 [Anaeromyxobacter diazotrophicus]
MSVRSALLALALSLPLTPARAADQACSIAITGAVQASFRCRISFLARGDGAVRVLVTPEKLPKTVKAMLPGEFELPAPVQAQVYPFDRLASAQVLLTGPHHATFSAVKGKKERRGDVTVTLTQVANVAGGHEALKPSLSGKMEAHLVPASKSAKGEARVTVTF